MLNECLRYALAINDKEMSFLRAFGYGSSTNTA
jgi:hypothetical protein